MTTLLSTPLRRPADQPPAPRRSAWGVGLVAGAVTAAVTLAACLLVALVGWFVADSGLHGSPTDALRVGAMAWLAAHGSGFVVDGVRITLVPLGITALTAWALWRAGRWTGETVSGHGPDADRIADGERDWTVPGALTGLALGHLAVLGITLRLAGGAAEPSAVRALLLGLLLVVVVAGPAVSSASGRLAIWTQAWPTSLLAAGLLVRQILRWWLLAALVTFLVALAADGATAANLLTQVEADPADSAVYALSSLLLLPNIVLFSGAYLLGPGFTVGAHTLVSPSAVVLGPLPLFPPLAALPDDGPVAAWTPWLVVVPALLAAVAAYRAAGRLPVTGWREALVRGCVGGVAAGLAFGLLATLAGGAVGPGRLQDVSPFVFAVTLHAVVAFAAGAVAGTLLATWRRHSRS